MLSTATTGRSPSPPPISTTYPASVAARSFGAVSTVASNEAIPAASAAAASAAATSAGAADAEMGCVAALNPSWAMPWDTRRA